MTFTPSDIQYLTASQRNIMSVYVRADADSITQGMTWYWRANQVAQRLAVQYNIDTSTVCGVIAALSPRCSWSSNIKLAATVIDAHAHNLRPEDCKGLKNNIKKAFSILDGGSPLDVLSGFKVKAFYRSLMRYDNACCVDTHAISICLGERATEKQTGAVFSNEKRYSAYVEDYMTVADMLGLLPSQLQAITWVQWRKDLLAVSDEF